MRTVVAFSAVLYGLTIATPLERRQGINVDAYEAAASLVTSNQPPVGDSAPQTTVGYDPTTIIEKVVAQVTSAPSDDDINTAAVIAKRAATVCTTRTFNGPRVTAPADTPEAFVAYQPFTDAAVSAAKDENIPEGYNVVTGFVNLPATANAPNYLSYVSSVLTGYNPGQCAAICDGMAGCNAFVIYNERVPLVVSTLTQVPDSNVCPASSTSASATLIKCAFYGVPPTAAQATNSYQFQGKFKVVWTGANAYSKKSVPAVQGFRGPVSFGDYTINVPTPALNYGFLRSETFGANVPFDPSLCAASCLAQTPANAQSGNFNGSACMFFDAHIVYKNGLNGIFTCNYYSIEYDSSNATYSGQTISKDKYTVGYSYGYYLDMDLPSTCSSIFVSTFTPSA
ncbi:hypothetical protein GQ53DRAFT_645969 [Thozetella sp. PMI_491]|nr:hypothetical protein GQ53DRAFT_645969 [Thozetella sp. PMI_491]